MASGVFEHSRGCNTWRQPDSDAKDPNLPEWSGSARATFDEENVCGSDGEREVCVLLAKPFVDRT
jgi:hypothetical protein